MSCPHGQPSDYGTTFAQIARALAAHAGFAGKASQRGYTLVPLRMYFKNGKAKVELAVASGKKLHDKRESLKKADAQREIRRAMSDRRR